ncbi:MAG TPA: tyrosine-protein phosphatase [Caulobacteraceae bacterium]|jgi:protein tyrosine/serine phosphatase
MDQRFAFEGLDNFRDFGGFPAADSRRLRAGRLYRSASHGRATDADLEALHALGISVIVDLRREAERERDPSRRHPEFACEVIASGAGYDEGDSWLDHITSSDLSPESFRAYMLRYYRDAPFNPRLIDLYSRYFQALAEVDGPVLIHCSAGKDRTGILAALTHHVAGVAPEHAMADYLATNDPVRLERRLPQVTQVIFEHTGRTLPPETVMVAMGVEAQYLDTAFAAMGERCGDTDRYLAEALGVGPDIQAAVRARLLAPA